MKVLVPVDGSAHSMEAVKVAVDFGRSKNARVYVISVVPSFSAMEDHEISPARLEKHMGSVERLADEAVRQACDMLEAQDVKATSTKIVLTSSSVPDAIIDFAEEENIDLIIMGSRGLSASSRFKMGSVASRVAKYSSCSVYLVKSPSERERLGAVKFKVGAGM